MRLGKRHIAHGEVLLPSCTTISTTPGTLVHRLVGIGFQNAIGRNRSDAFGPSIGQKRDGVIAHHAAGLARERPGWQPATLVLGLKECFHIAALLSGM